MRSCRLLVSLVLGLFRLPCSFAATVPAYLAGVKAGPVAVAATNEALTETWPDRDGSREWRAIFSLDSEKPLITSIALGGGMVLQGGRPFYQVETGKRRGGWNEFFDFPGSHPDGTRHFQAEFRLRSAKARTIGDRVELLFDGLRLGIFEGGVAYTIYPGSGLIQQEAVMTTHEADVAYFYDAGIVTRAPGDERPGRNMQTELAYYDTEGALQK